MPPTHTQTGFDHDAYVQNRNSWTYEQFAPYLGHWIAWNLDGKSIAAHAPDLKDLMGQLNRSGIGGEEVLLDYLPGGDAPDTLL